MLDHLVGGSLHHEIGAVQIDLHRPLEGLDGHVEKGVERADAGIVDEHVDPPERGDRLGDEVGRGLGIGNVALDRHALAAERLDLGDGAFGTRHVAREVERDVGAVPRTADRHCAANAGRCTGDEHRLACE